MERCSRVFGAACAVSLAAGLALAAAPGSAVGASGANPVGASVPARVLHASETAAQVSAPEQVDPSWHGHSEALNSTNTVGTYAWAGVAETSKVRGAFTSVDGSFVVPAVTCTPEFREVAAWVGLDGAGDNTVEQDGVNAVCLQGKPYYFTWYEMYPNGSKIVGKSVRPGDHIRASVSRSGAAYTLSVVDSTTSGNNVNGSGACTTCLNESAEWIVERPYIVPTGDTPLAQFAQLNWATASYGASTKSTAQQADVMLNTLGAYELAEPLSAGGNAFGVKWLDSY